MDFLKAEVEKRKRALEAVKNTAGEAGIVTAPDGRKVYVKRNENISNNGISSASTLLSTSSSSSSASSSSTITAPSILIINSNNGTTQISSLSSSTPSSSTPITTVSSSSSVPEKHGGYSSTLLSKSDIIQRCRKYGLVTTYFGENDHERLQRLIQYETKHLPVPVTSTNTADEHNTSSLITSSPILLTHEHNDSTTTTATTTATSNPITSSSSSSSASSSALDDTSVQPEQKRKRIHYDEPVPISSTSSSSSSIPSSTTPTVPSSEEKQRQHTDALKYKNKDNYKYLYSFWRGLLYEWEQIIQQQRSVLESTALGKQEILLYKQAEEYMRPFFKGCKHENLPEDIYKLVMEITDALLIKDYIKAGDSYMKLAIGNQQWVMGVSQVGLHERSAREKVYVGKITHVLNDEAQRRYITTMKRLMTFLEKQYPTDPSKMV